MKLAIVGNGNIVKEALVVLKSVNAIELKAICVREQSRHKGESLAADYQIPYLYTDYDELLKAEDVDTIYIGIINLLHYEYAKKALMAGKHVILEKPSCIKSEEMQELADIATQRKLYFFEAVTFLHAPYFKKIQSLLPSIGKIKLVQCNFSKYSSRYDQYLKKIVHPVFDPACAGGTLLDMNIYNLNFSVALLGEPQDTLYIANKGFNNVDTSGVAVLKYADFISVCTAAKDSTSPGFMMIQGEKGYIHVEGRPDRLKSLNIVYNDLKDGSIHMNLETSRHRMIDEFTEFATILEAHDYGKMEEFLKISIQVCRTSEKCLKG